MNQRPDNPSQYPPPSPAAAPSNWLDAIACLISSRIALIQLEARASARRAAIRAVKIAAAALCVLLSWILLIAGGIGAIAAATQWSWHWLAIGAGLLHLAAALALTTRRKPEIEAPFPLTRAEFEKDRQWLETLKKKNGSEN